MPGPRFGLEGSSSPDEQYARDLGRAAGFKPISQEDLKVAYSQYDQAVGQVKRADKDPYLFKRATDTVITWWKKQRADEAAAKAETARQQAAEAQARAEDEQRARDQEATEARHAAAAAQAARAQATQPSSGFMLPNTAMGGPSTAPKLKPIPEPITTAYVNEQLRRNGLVGSKPPASALKNKDTFHAWQNSAIEWMRRNQTSAVKTATGTKVVYKPIAGNRNPVIR